MKCTVSLLKLNTPPTLPGYFRIGRHAVLPHRGVPIHRLAGLIPMLPFLRRLLSASLTAMLLVCACSYAHGQQVVKIGVSSPLTGINAAHGKDMQNGVRLAIEEANAQQFKLGGKDVRFELHAVDDQSDPRTGNCVRCERRPEEPDLDAL